MTTQDISATSQTLAQFNVVLIATYEMGRQPFGLASPAAWLRAEGAHVTCLDLALEKLNPQAIAKTPKARPEIAGLLNLRGQIVTAVDLRKRLRLPANPADKPSMNVVLRYKQAYLGLAWAVLKFGEDFRMNPAAA